MRALRSLTALLLLAMTMPTAFAEELNVYVGTYTGKESKGIYLLKFNTETGKLSTPEVAVETKNPSFLAIHPSKKFLYAVGEGGTGVGVSAFSIGADGKLTLLNGQGSGGKGPAHISLDPAGKNALVANYGSGSIACLPIGADGKLAEASSTIQHEGGSVNPSRQKGPHAHSIYAEKSGNFVVSADLGLDKVLVYKFDAASGKLTPNDPPATATKGGAGPRHFAFHPNGKLAFVINELNSTLTSFAWDGAKGTLTEVQTLSTLPEGHTGNNSTAEVVVHPSGKFVYGSNRGHDSIAAYAVDDAGKLTSLGNTPIGGKTPRNFNIDPSGKWLLAAGQGSGTITVFKIDEATGKLTAAGDPVAVPSPVCIKFN